MPIGADSPEKVRTSADGETLRGTRAAQLAATTTGKRQQRAQAVHREATASRNAASRLLHHLSERDGAQGKLNAEKREEARARREVHTKQDAEDAARRTLPVL